MLKKEKKKEDYLRENKSLNVNASKVKDDLFMKNNFFDPLDLIQVKYEILRKVSKKKCSVDTAVNLFGMSRQNYYKIKNAFEKQGMAGLLEKKRGPRHPFKLKENIVDFVNKQKKENPSITSIQIVNEIKNKFNLSIHHRTIERFNKAQKKTSKRRKEE